MKRLVLLLVFLVPLNGCAHLQAQQNTPDLIDRGGEYGSTHHVTCTEVLGAVFYGTAMLGLAMLDGMSRSNWH